MKKIVAKFVLSKKHHILLFTKSAYWFGVGVILGLFFLISFAFIIFQQVYKNVVFPGVMVNGVNFGGKSQLFVENYFDSKNKAIKDSVFTFVVDSEIATASAETLSAGYNSQLLAEQAMSIGRSGSLLSDISLVFQAYLSGINLSPSFTYSDKALQNMLVPLEQALNTPATDAIFQFDNGKVTTFKPSSDGQEVDTTAIDNELSTRIPLILAVGKPQSMTIISSLHVVHPKITTGDANNLGIKDLIGTGTSLFQYSIPSRIYNVTLASTRVNGTLVAPGDTFSFAKALGDVSSYTGYQQAYVIQNGHTVLGDGGGVCQVSTTLFRAALNAGLPIVERHAHDYRVEYYEEDGPPGIDATVYVPTVDLKFKNDTGHYILIQSVIDPTVLRLTFYIYGTSDGRQTTLTTPIITDQTPAPPPLYQDDPTLSKGVTKQVDFAAAGAKVTFSRTVMKDGKPYIQDTYVSNYQPWQAVYLVGTKE